MGRLKVLCLVFLLSLGGFRTPKDFSGCSRMFSMYEGTSLTYKKFHANGDSYGWVKYTVMNHTLSGEKHGLKIQFETFDANGRSDGPAEFTMVCEPEAMKMSVKPFFSSHIFRGDTSWMDIKENYLVYPKDLYTSQPLPSAWIDFRGKTMSDDRYARIRFNIMGRKVTNAVDIKSEEKVFPCYVIEGFLTMDTFTADGKAVTRSQKFREYYNNETGIVKREFMLANDKILYSEELDLNN